MKEGDFVTIIGNLKFENNNNVLEYDNAKNLYVVIPINSSENYFKNRSLLDKWIDKTEY